MNELDVDRFFHYLLINGGLVGVADVLPNHGLILLAKDTICFDQQIDFWLD